MGPSIAMVGELAAQPAVRPACDCLALAPSRLVAALGIWLTWPLAWRTPADPQRDPRPYCPNEPRWGAPRIHGELLKLGFDVSQATVSRYMARRSYPPTQSWRTFLRNQALGMIVLGDAGRISGRLLTLVRGGTGLAARAMAVPKDIGFAESAAFQKSHPLASRRCLWKPKRGNSGSPIPPQ
jgi:hypothetical protein